MKKSISFLSYVILFAFLILSYHEFVYKHAYNIVKAKLIVDFENKMTLKTYLSDNTVSRYVEGAKSISSRSMIRNKIVDYYNGKLSFEELRDYTKPKYVDGIKALENCISALRLVDDQVLVTYSNNSQSARNIPIPESLPGMISSKIYINNDTLNVLVISPILKDKTIYGYDILLSGCNKLIHSITDSNEVMRVLKEDEVIENFNLPIEKKLSFADTMILKNDSAFYLARSNHADVYWCLAKKKKHVFEELYDFQKRQMIIMILIVVVFGLILFLIQKRNQVLFLKKSRILEDMVNEKTKNLNSAITKLEYANQELSKRENELVLSNQTKDKFFSIIAHDLLNPLNAVTLLTEVLYKKYDTNDVDNKKKLLETILHSLQDTLKLLENLLTWSRSQRGIITFNPEKINLHNIVKDVLDVLHVQFLNKNQTIKNQIPKDAAVKADKFMLNTIIRNLLSNAIKFTGIDGVIEIGVMNDQGGEKRMAKMIYIKDNGVGMETETLNKLFKISDTSSLPGTNNENGTGLGLILCKEFIEKHNGQITVESTLGTGSTFKFTILDSES